MRISFITLFSLLTLNSCYTVLRVQESAVETDFAAISSDSTEAPSSAWLAYYQNNDGWWTETEMTTETEYAISDEYTPRNYGRRRRIDNANTFSGNYAAYAPPSQSNIISEPIEASYVAISDAPAADVAAPVFSEPAAASSQSQKIETGTARSFGTRHTVKK